MQARPLVTEFALFTYILPCPFYAVAIWAKTYHV